MEINFNIDKETLLNLTKTQSIIYYYFKQYPEKVAYKSVLEVAQEIGVSTASIVRFCQTIGYEGYSHLQNYISKSIAKDLTLPKKFQTTIKETNNGNLLSKSFTRDVENIINSLDDLDEVEINNCIQDIIKSKRVYILGMREAHALAHYSYTRLRTIMSNVSMINGAGTLLFPEEISAIDENDIVLAFLFPRYTNVTIEIIKALYKNNVKIALVSSVYDNEISQFVKYLFICKVTTLSFKNSYVAPMALINYFATAIALENIDESMKNMDILEKSMSLSL